MEELREMGCLAAVAGYGTLVCWRALDGCMTGVMEFIVEKGF